jgi:hypothetical protein
MAYDRQEDGWRIQEFFFDNGQEVTLKASRREYKKQARVPLSKFRLVTPDDALRIVP